MNRGFGSSVRDLIFQLDSFNLTDRVNFAVTRAMQHRRYGEQRIFVNSMTVKLDRTTAAADIDMQAVLRSANVESNLVFPFYLRDDERLAAERDIEARTSDPLT